MLEHLERLTREFYDIETEENSHTHLDYAVEQLKSGRTIADMARSLSTLMQDTLARETLASYLHSLPEGTERITNAKPTQALAMIEDAVAIVDEYPDDKLAVAHAVARARVRESHAKMIHPEFAPNRGTNVHIGTSVGMLHLTAVKMSNDELSRALAIGTSHADARVSLEPDQSSVVQIASHK